MTNWVYAYDYARTGFGSNHPGGAIFAFCDGSVRFLTNAVSTSLIGNTNLTILDALCSYNGGEVIPDNY